MQSESRKRRANEDAAKEVDRPLPANQGIAVELFKSLWVLPNEQIQSICETWLPNKTAQRICLLDNAAHLKSGALNYGPMKGMIAMLQNMAAIQIPDDRAKAITTLVTGISKRFFKTNVFEVDLHLMQEFFKAPSAQGDSQIVGKNVQYLMVIVQVQSSDGEAQLAFLLEFLDHNKTVSVTIKFRGPGAKDGSDACCQRRIAQLCGVINDILVKSQGKNVVNIVREQGIWGLEYAIFKWFRKPSGDVVARFENGTASYDESMQVQVAQWIRDIKESQVTEVVKQEATN